MAARYPSAAVWCGSSDPAEVTTSGASVYTWRSASASSRSTCPRTSTAQLRRDHHRHRSRPPESRALRPCEPKRRARRRHRGADPPGGRRQAARRRHAARSEPPASPRRARRRPRRGERPGERAMTTTYVDTSALLKRYVDEHDSGRGRSVADRRPGARRELVDRSSRSAATSPGCWPGQCSAQPGRPSRETSTPSRWSQRMRRPAGQRQRSVSSSAFARSMRSHLASAQRLRSRRSRSSRSTCARDRRQALARLDRRRGLTKRNETAADRVGWLRGTDRRQDDDRSDHRPRLCGHRWNAPTPNTGYATSTT